MKMGSHETSINKGCGIGSCRPRIMRSCATMPAFTAMLSAVVVFGSVNYSYYTGVIGQIERQFGLSSRTTGFIKNVDNIGYMCTVLLFSHMLRNCNNPRLFSVASVATGVAIAAFALPYFLFDYTGLVVDLGDNSTISNVSVAANKTLHQMSSMYELCGTFEGNKQHVDKPPLGEFNRGALIVFMVSEFLQGVAQSSKFSLSMTYVDDNSSNKNTPKYFGVIFATRAAGPLMGFALAAYTNSIYVDLSDPGIDIHDSRWVGAWWLGYLVCGMVTLLCAIPIAMFPAGALVDNAEVADEIKVDADSVAVPETEELTICEPTEVEQDTTNLTDLPLSIARVVHNPIFVPVVLGISIHFYIIGFFTFLPKYQESQFDFSASQASALIGVTSTACMTIGPLIGGKIMSSGNMTALKALKIIFCVQISAAILYLLCMSIGTDGNDIQGVLDFNSRNLTSNCNTGCGCDGVDYMPVCSPEGMTFYSPCHAGCTQANGAQFSGCTCTGNGKATSGRCLRTKWLLWAVYCTCLSSASLLSSITTVPIIMIMMKSVQNRDKAIGFALFGTASMIISFPAAAFFGALVDNTCLVFQSLGSHTKGACLRYDNTWFRYYLHGLAAVVELASGLMYGAALLAARHTRGKLKSRLTCRFDS